MEQKREKKKLSSSSSCTTKLHTLWMTATHTRHLAAVVVAAAASPAVQTGPASSRSSAGFQPAKRLCWLAASRSSHKLSHGQKWRLERCSLFFFFPRKQQQQQQTHTHTHTEKKKKCLLNTLFPFIFFTVGILFACPYIISTHTENTHTTKADAEKLPSSSS